MTGVATPVTARVGRPFCNRAWPVVIGVARSLSPTLDELKGLAVIRLTPADNPKQIRGYAAMIIDATAPCAIVPPRVIGCDVGKTTITVFDTLTGRITEIANHALALIAFAEALPPDCLVVCEATGGYERALLLATAAALMPELGSLTGRPGRIPRRACPTPPSERTAGRLSSHPGRTTRGQARPVHGRHGRAKPQPHRQGRLPAVDQKRQKTLVAITALMRKLITIINARTRDAQHRPAVKLS